MSKNLLRILFIGTALALIAAAPIFAKSPDRPAASTPSITFTAPQAEIKKDGDAADTFKQLALFSDVLERVRADYVDPVTDEKLIETALNGMLSSLDPHSGYLNKKSFQEMKTQTSGEFGGLGIEVTMDNGLVKVISPIDDTPAAKAGIQSSDLITHIDSKPVMELTLSDAVDRMRGTPGTKVVLTIRRGGLSGQPFDVSLTRAVIHIQSVKWETKDNVAYIRITTFNEQTQPGLDKALAEADDKIGAKLEGYVIDLRNDPGGLLEQAISVAGSFLPPGVDVVSTRGRHKEDDQTFIAKGGDKAHGKPIVVLINGGSASASEIVAGALQDHKRALLVGTKSFGKGSVQTIIPASGGGAMRLTTARYYTPSGRSIQALGIEPDIAVQPAKLEKIAQGHGLREADLKGALQNDTVKAGKDDGKSQKSSTVDPADDEGAVAEGSSAPSGKGKPSGKNDKPDAPYDYQLARALDLIRGIHVFESRRGGG
ncbi:MAG: S41 family peptidase [Bdellovibrionales bacterium]